MAVRKTRPIAVLAITVLALIFLMRLPVSASNFTIWSSMDSGTGANLNGVWGADDSNIFAVGSSGTIIHYDGSTWSSTNSSTGKDLYSVWGANSAAVFAVGSSGTIIHYDGSAWSSMNSGTASDLYCVWGDNSTDIFAVGELRYHYTLRWLRLELNEQQYRRVILMVSGGLNGMMSSRWGAPAQSCITMAPPGAQ